MCGCRPDDQWRRDQPSAEIHSMAVIKVRLILSATVSSRVVSTHQNLERA